MTPLSTITSRTGTRSSSWLKADTSPRSRLTPRPTLLGRRRLCAERTIAFVIMQHLDLMCQGVHLDRPGDRVAKARGQGHTEIVQVSREEDTRHSEVRAWSGSVADDRCRRPDYSPLHAHEH